MVITIAAEAVAKCGRGMRPGASLSTMEQVPVPAKEMVTMAMAGMAGAVASEAWGSLAIVLEGKRAGMLLPVTGRWWTGGTTVFLAKYKPIRER